MSPSAAATRGPSTLTREHTVTPSHRLYSKGTSVSLPLDRLNPPGGGGLITHPGRPLALQTASTNGSWWNLNLLLCGTEMLQQQCLRFPPPMPLPDPAKQSRRREASGHGYLQSHTIGAQVPHPMSSLASIALSTETNGNEKTRRKGLLHDIWGFTGMTSPYAATIRYTS